MKKILISILENPAIGRPTRKSLWLTIKLLKFLTLHTERIFSKLPYVKSLSLAAEVDDPASTVVRYYKYLKERVVELPFQPKISVIIPVYKVKEDFFRECLQSVSYQLYENWELCIVDDASNVEYIPKVVEEFSEQHPGKIKFSTNKVNSHISVTSNECLKLATGEYVALLDHDDRLMPNALAEMVRHINLKDRPEILYSDERVIDEKGKGRGTAYYKPSWSKYMHLSVNYTTHLSCYKRTLLDEIGGFRAGTEGAQDHDLMLRATEKTSKAVVHVPFVLYQWRAHEESTAQNITNKSYAYENGEKCVHEAIDRRGMPGVVTYEPETVHYRVKFDLRAHPLISIIIPTKDSLKDLKTCVESILDKSSYQNFEIILSDNGTTEKEVLAYYHQLEDRLGNRFKALIEPHPFNFGAQINRGVENAKGDFVLLLNNDTEIIDNDWMEEMLRVGQHSDVGAVGCKLIYRNNIVQHAGILLISDFIATAINGKYKDDPIYCQIYKTMHETMAVTAACLLVEKSKFDEVGGFNSSEVANGYGDVDFCLKLVKKGYSNIYTPYANLYHDESPSRGVSFEAFERHYMREKWGQFLLNDPYLNKNLRLMNGFEPDVNCDYQDIEGKLMNIFLSRPFDEWQQYSAF